MKKQTEYWLSMANDDLSVIEEIITEINETYIDARYPADLGLLPSGKPNQTLAREFADAAIIIYREIKEFLSKQSNT